MASDLIARERRLFTAEVSDEQRVKLWPLVEEVLQPLASLKLTVVLLALAIGLIFIGTLAQEQADINEILKAYFRNWFAWIDFKVLVPYPFFPRTAADKVGAGFDFLNWHISGFYYPGGWLIGGLMGLNLFAAHGLRFKVQASGRRLLAGMGVIAAGAALVAAVVMAGNDMNSVRAAGDDNWKLVWMLVRLGLSAAWLTMFIALFRLKPGHRFELILLCAGCVLLGALVAWYWFGGASADLSGSSLRILWQLIKGGAAGALLLAGCALVFRKRAGVVLLHAGIGLMMINEVVVYNLHQETSMSLSAGDTLDYAHDIRSMEISVVDATDPDRKFDEITVIPQSVLLNAADSKELIKHELLPFDVQVLKLLKNSELTEPAPGDDNFATAGIGKSAGVKAVPTIVGTDSDQRINMPSLYVRFLDKRQGHEGSSLGTYLLTYLVSTPQPIHVGDAVYELALQPKRVNKPYSVHLNSVRATNYMGTSKPRDYTSRVRIHMDGPGGPIDRDDLRIWMNNPLRFAGDTFYQSGYAEQSGKPTTTLSIVSNTGWMIPYIGCMLVATGMLAHFGLTLLRFLNRQGAPAGVAPAEVISESGREDEEEQQSVARRRHRPASSVKASGPMQPPETWRAWWFPSAVVLVFAGWLLSRAMPPRPADNEMNLYEAGKLPVVAGGRPQPLDSLARITLRGMCESEAYVDEDNGKQQPAIRWLLDVITDAPDANKHRVFRVENPQVQDVLHLEGREGLCYSVDELLGKPDADGNAHNIDNFYTQIRAIKQKPKKKTDIFDPTDAFDIQMLKLDNQIRIFTSLKASFRPLPFPEMPDHSKKISEEEKASLVAEFRQYVNRALSFEEELKDMDAPLSVPPLAGSDKKWLPYSIAAQNALLAMILHDREQLPAMRAWTQIFADYGRNDAARFNADVIAYEQELKSSPPTLEPGSKETLDTQKIGVESWFNHFRPFYDASALYLVAFALSALGWLGWRKQFNRAAFCLIGLTFLIHTTALVLRIYISGRPPVTNLYSSALFVGWGCCLFGLVFEAIYKLGVGNVIAAVAGFSTLLIANFLSNDGDTLGVLEAVLDTQFWLATHVVCVSSGYFTTFFAGLLGIVYVLLGVFTPSLSRSVSKDLSRMIYGTLCFATLFSFVGTVLGGLWADDSWGRFWGWDPKENGALIIVLWNALVLHARWAGLVKERGLAVMVIVGNIVLAWSWFGVNALGIGLHSYGFNATVVTMLEAVAASHLALIAIGLVPKKFWLSSIAAAK